MSRLEQLEQLSRQGPLRPAESLELERLLCRAEKRPLSNGFNREAARAGFNRSGKRLSS